MGRRCRPRSAQTLGFVLGGLASSCGPPLPGVDSAPSVELVEVTGGWEAAAPNARMRLEGAGLLRGSPWLIRGEVSRYHLQRVESGELPTALTERAVRSSAFGRVPERVVVTGREWLEPGERYSLVMARLGLLGTVKVTATSVEPWLQRRWPPRTELGVTRSALYCGEGERPRAVTTLPLEPDGTLARVGPTLGGRGVEVKGCVWLELAEPAAGPVWALPPQSHAGDLFEPQPLLLGDAPLPPEPAPCRRDERAVLGACLRVEEDRLELRSVAPLLWLAELEDRTELGTSAAARSWWLRGLPPDTAQQLALTRVTTGGAVDHVTVSFRTLPGRARLVISEVLANPRGPEPAQEWVELVNEGTAPAELQGVRLEDEQGASVLPSYWLEPGERVLVVSERFLLESELDVPIPREVGLVRVPALGQGGLSNAGEALRLRLPEGQIVSRFPGLAAPVEGRSVARRAGAPDDDPLGFGPHAAPGASPGAENSLRGPE